MAQASNSTPIFGEILTEWAQVRADFVKFDALHSAEDFPLEMHHRETEIIGRLIDCPATTTCDIAAKMDVLEYLATINHKVGPYFDDRMLRFTRSLRSDISRWRAEPTQS